MAGCWPCLWGSLGGCARVSGGRAGKGFLDLGLGRLRGLGSQIRFESGHQGLVCLGAGSAVAQGGDSGFCDRPGKLDSLTRNPNTLLLGKSYTLRPIRTPLQFTGYSAIN